MKKTTTYAIALILCFALVFALCPLSVSAEVKEEVTPTARTAAAEPASAKNYMSLYSVKNKSASAYQSGVLTYNGRKLSTSTLTINGTVYVPLRMFIEELTDMKVTYNSQSRTLYVNGYGLSLSVSDGAYVIYANDRPLFALSPSVIMSNGKMYSPLASAAKALSLGYKEGSSSLSGSVRALTPASSFYREDEVYWLSRIIGAESGGESLLGQLGVGSVVLNRVASPQYPATIWGVIFDKKYGVQFSPVSNGTIYNTPGYTSVLAAKICLEGFRVSSDALFFMEPQLSTSSWIPKNREYLFSILHHDFYA